MENELRTWRVIHIPDKPQIPPHQQPTVDVFASAIEPKLANTLVRRLNQVAPLEDLRHVKRIWKKQHKEGETQLSVILCLADDDKTQSRNMPKEVKELVNNYQLSPFIAKIRRTKPIDMVSWKFLALCAKEFNVKRTSCIHELYSALLNVIAKEKSPYISAELPSLVHLWFKERNVSKDAASSKEEWEEQCKLWPTSYHPPTFNIDGITGFNEEDTSAIFKLMKFAIGLATSADYLIVNAAVIVDPSCKQIIASASDQVSPWRTSRNKSSTESYNANAVSDSMVECVASPSNGLSDNVKSPYAGVSCLNPWHWDKQSLEASCTDWHPLRHAAMVAIETSAARDRDLHPSSNGPSGNNCCDGGCTEACSEASPAKRQKFSASNIENDEEHDCGGSLSLSSRPYLCTGYDIYLVWEPCVMCAMALVHQRIRRIFYAFPNPGAGALGSVERLQGEKSLNHHYAVFRVVVPEEEVLVRS